MKNKSIFAVMITLIVVGSLVSYAFTNRHAVSGDQPIAPFHKIEVAGAWEVYISNAATTTLRTEGPQEEIDHLSAEVKNGTLIIKNKNENWSHKGTVKIYVSTNDLEEVELSGSGLISLEQKFTNNSSMEFSLSGSGKIKGEISSPDVDVDIAGSGDIVLSGDTKDLDLEVAGSGKFDGKNFKSNNADVDVAGSGDAIVSVDTKLEAEIAGSGNIYYTGNPDVKKEIAGSGNVIAN